LEIDPEFIEDFSFQDVWETFELKDFLNSNLIVCWDDESEILEKVLKTNQIKDYSIKYIKIREIAQDNKLPDLIDSLLLHFDSDLTLEDDLSLIVSSLAIDLKDSGIVLENYIHNLNSIKKSAKSKKPKSIKSHKKDFISIDVETAIGKRWSICQIGLAIVENGELKQTITELIQPPNNEYSKYNTKIHGITSEMTFDKPFFPEVWNKIYPIIENKKLVAHNAEFDINCLHQTLNYYNLEIPNFDCDCTFKKTGQALNEACASFDVSIENHHDAGCDAEACANLYIKVLDGVNPDFSKVKPKFKPKPKQPFDLEGHDRIQGDVLKPDLESADPNSPLYNKKVVFTGVLEKIKRQEAAEIVKKMGADIDTGITKKTNYVITGTDPGPSKMNKIIKYNNDGCNINILYEKDFLEMINEQ
jgi:DNA polymerase-3 subunit epsilon